MRLMIRLCGIGIMAGLLFGGLLKSIEELTHRRVYVLLLNVDYFPILKNIQMNEAVEFSFHLIVSIVLVYTLYFAIEWFDWKQKVTTYMWINMVIGCALFLTTSFSERTPELLDVAAFIYWTGGHVVFGILVGTMIYFLEKEK